MAVSTLLEGQEEEGSQDNKETDGSGRHSEGLLVKIK